MLTSGARRAQRAKSLFDRRLLGGEVPVGGVYAGDEALAGGEAEEEGGDAEEDGYGAEPAGAEEKDQP